jgi:hypothetical protein
VFEGSMSPAFMILQMDYSFHTLAPSGGEFV